MTYMTMLGHGEGFRAVLKGAWGEETEFGRPVQLKIDVELRKDPEGFRLSICAYLLIKECEKYGLKAIKTGGQCIDSAIEYLAENGLCCQTLEKIEPIWKKWHLNDCHAGTERQDACLDEYRKAHPGERLEYEKAREILQENGILEDDQYLVDGKPYEYGTKWLFREIPQEVLKRLCRLLDSVGTNICILPTKEKEKFLHDNGI